MMDWITVLAAGASGGAAVWFWARGERRRAMYAAAVLVFCLLAGVLFLGQVLKMQKLAASLLLPLTAMWLGSGAAAIYSFARGHRRAGILCGLCFVVYGLGGNPSVSAMLQQILERKLPPHVPVTELPEFEAVFVLGGGAVKRPDTGDIQLTKWGDRLIVAAEVYHAKKTPILVASGGEGDYQTGPTTRLWKMMGIPEEAIRQIPRGRTTSEEIVEYAKMIEQEGWKRVGLVTSAYHFPRATRTAQRLGVEMTPIPVDRTWGASLQIAPFQALPRAEVWMMTEQVLWELMGMAVGR